MRRGLFIVFEGIDGCGKSTQLWLLAKHLFELDKHNHMIITREPYKDANIRQILFEEKDPHSQAEKLAELFIKDRKNHMDNVILPNINKGNHVISDRYSFSTLAYQNAQGIPLEKLMNMHKGIIIPDLIFILDVAPKIVQKRMNKDKKRKKKHIFDKDIIFIEKLRQNFIKLKNLKNHNVIIVDGSKKPEHIFNKYIKPHFDKLYNSHLSS